MLPRSAGASGKVFALLLTSCSCAVVLIFMQCISDGDQRLMDQESSISMVGALHSWWRRAASDRPRAFHHHSPGELASGQRFVQLAREWQVVHPAVVWQSMWSWPARATQFMESFPDESRDHQ